MHTAFTEQLKFLNTAFSHIPISIVCEDFMQNIPSSL